MFSKFITREGKLLLKNFHDHFSVQTLRTSNRHPFDILADVRHRLTDIQWTSDGHSGGHPTDILADVRRTFCGRLMDILAEIRRTFFGRPTDILADIRIKFQRMQSIGTECPTDVRCICKIVRQEFQRTSALFF